MLKILKIFFLLVFPFMGYTQINLVPNGSFENYSQCPTGTDQTDYAIGWTRLKQTPDYFNSCSTSTCNCNYPGQLCASVPMNCGGFQYASSGSAYSGLATYVSFIPNYRETIGTQLSNTLSIGQKYFVKFKIAFTWGANSNTATDKIGIRFTTVQHNSVTALPPINNFAHVYSTNAVTDTTNWTLVLKSFTADSVYKYIEVGNFYDDANTTKSIQWASGSNESYYYFDDLCVSTDSLFTLNFTTGLSENNIINNYLKANPNYNNKIIFNKILNKASISFINYFGQEVRSYFIESSDYLEIDLSDGIYFVKIKEGNLETIEKLIIKNQ